MKDHALAAAAAAATSRRREIERSLAKMEPGNSEEASTENENAKISDSGYSNTCSNSQSHTSSGSFVSRNSNRSKSSGYHGGNQSSLDISTDTLPKPVGKRKDKTHKKKKSKIFSIAITTHHAEVANDKAPVAVASSTSCPAPVSSAQQAILTVEPPACKSSAFLLREESTIVASTTTAVTTEELAAVELVDATDPGVHNNGNDINKNNLASVPEAELASKTNAIDELTFQSSEEYAVISMYDGLVLCATPSLHTSLGYPQDSWTGKLFTDFLDPRDKDVLDKKIANDMAIYRDHRSAGKNAQKESIFCRLRKNNAESSDNDGSQYKPYRANLLVINYHGDKLTTLQNQVTLLAAFFQPVSSAYKVPEETIISAMFTTRHTADCRLSYVDPDVVQYFGYLPQDMIDRSLFDFYHPEDLPLIKNIYETVSILENLYAVINLDNSSYRSKPYRFIVHNGDFVVLETEWSSFINPWTKNLEFVVGRHRVLRGPMDPNVFRSADPKNYCLANISEEVLKEAKIIENEVMALLIQGVQKKSSCAVMDCDLLSKKNELTSFVENMLLEIKSPAPIKDYMAIDERSFSEHDSVMLGEISPHHEYLDSKSSTETPPSYNQLNYHDNIERFFNSNLGMSVSKKPYGSDEDNLHSSGNSSDEHGKNNSGPTLELKCTSSTNGSGNSGSAENLSSESNNQQSSGSRGETSNTTSNSANETAAAGGNSVKPAILTESLLIRHNEDMEKLMMKKHREQKKGEKRNKNSLNEKKVKQQQQQQHQSEQQPNSAFAAKPEITPKISNRLKRGANQNWESHKFNHNAKVLKHEGASKVTQNDATIAERLSGSTTMPPTMTTTITTMMSTTNLVNVDNGVVNEPTNLAKVNNNNNNNNNNVGLWPTTMSATMMPSTATIAQHRFATTNSQTMGRLPAFPQMYPVYYVPVPQLRDNLPLTALPQEHPGPSTAMSQPAPYCYVPVPYAATAMSGVMYPSMIGPVYRPFMVPESVPTATQHIIPVNLVSQPPPSTPNYTESTAINNKNNNNNNNNNNNSNIHNNNNKSNNNSSNNNNNNASSSSTIVDHKRADSRETSIKAEPGSTMAMSESSKKIFSLCDITSSCVSNEGGCYSVTDEYTTVKDNEDKANSSSQNGSSLFSSLLNKSYDSGSSCYKTDQRNTASSYECKENRPNQQHQRQTRKSMLRKEPPWIEGVQITPELVFQYQIDSKSLGDVLKTDLDFLRQSKQPSLVNDQLGQLFLDLDLEGFSPKLILEETGTNSADNSSDSSQSPSKMGAW